MITTIKPIQDRIIALDSIRGFALCGIIFANLVSFTGFYSLSFEQIHQLSWLDRGVLFAIDFFIEGKFYSVFAILFGAGFALQYARFKEKNQNFTPFWLRRMLVLMVIGLCHMYFIWHGDILTLYSLLGLCLLLFVKVNNRALLKWMLILLTLPLVIHLILLKTQSHAFWHSMNDVVISIRHILNYNDINLMAMRTSQNTIDTFWGNIFSAIPRPMSYLKTGRPFQVLGQFLLGIYLVRYYFQAKAQLPTGKQIFALLAIGCVLNLIYAYIKAITGSPFSANALGLLQGVVYHLGCTTMALGYIALLYRIWKSKSGFTGVATLGRMALSVYLMQTSICVMLFYGYGLSLMGKVPFYTILFFGTGILFMQFVFVNLWFKFFKFGPIEFLWRCLGYKGSVTQ